MIKQLKTIASTFTTILIIISVMGVPLFYHHCSVRGEHNWQSGFFIDNNEKHCICCEDIDDENTEDHHHHHNDCCGKASTSKSETTTITHAKCCDLQTISLKVVAVEQVQQSLKHVIPDLPFFEFIHIQLIIPTGETLGQPSPSPPPSIHSAFQSIIFLFSQFLL